MGSRERLPRIVLILCLILQAVLQVLGRPPTFVAIAKRFPMIMAIIIIIIITMLVFVAVCLWVFMLNGSPSSIIYNFFVQSGIWFILLFVFLVVVCVSWLYRSTRLTFAIVVSLVGLRRWFLLFFIFIFIFSPHHLTACLSLGFGRFICKVTPSE